MEVGEIIFIVTTVWEIVFSSCVTASLSPSVEKKILSSNNQSRPADVILPSGTQGKPAALDVTVVSSLQSTIIANAADTTGYALTYADDRKLAAHDADCREAGVSSLPLSFEVFGGWCETSRSTIKRIACLGDGRNAFSEASSVAINRLTESILIQLMLGTQTWQLPVSSKYWKRMLILD